MSLDSIVIATSPVKYGDQEFKVRGISARDIQAVLSRHRNSANLIFNLGQKAGINSINDITGENLRLVAVDAINTVPFLVAAIIACQTGNIEKEDVAADLPVQVQTEALMKIAQLTFDNPLNFGMFLGNVLSVSQMLREIPTKIGEIRSGVSLVTAGTMQ